MAIVRFTLQDGSEIPKEVIEMAKEAAKYPITFDEDCPELTDEQLAEFRLANPELYRPRKKQITLKVDADVLAAWRSTGKGYQTRMNAALREAACRAGLLRPATV